MKKKLVLASLLILTSTFCFAQSIRYVEYFIDVDPGFGMATSIPVTPANNIDISHTIPLEGIENGVHILYFRARDIMGSWSTTFSRPFVKLYLHNDQVDVKGLEYFIDDDPGVGNGMPIVVNEPLADVEIAFNINTSGMEPGDYKLFVRAIDSRGNWSFVYTKEFYLEAGTTPEYTLTISVVGNGTTSPSAGEYTFSQGETVTLTATPDSGNVFEKWVIDDEEQTANPVEVTINANMEVVAHFAEEPPVTYTLTVSVSGEGITSPTAGTHNYLENETVTLVASAVQGWEFTKWVINENDIEENPTSITMNTNSIAVAHFLEESTSVETGVFDKLIVFPNPFNLSFEVNNASSVSKLVVLNVVGQQVMDLHFSGQNKFTINASELHSGLYLLIFQSSTGERLVKKLIKQ